MTFAGSLCLPAARNILIRRQHTRSSPFPSEFDSKYRVSGRLYLECLLERLSEPPPSQGDNSTKRANALRGNLIVFAYKLCGLGKKKGEQPSLIATRVHSRDTGLAILDSRDYRVGRVSADWRK